MTGNRAPRMRPGGIHMCRGDGRLLITAEWGQETPQAFLAMSRAHGRGWQLIVCEARGSPQTAAAPLALASALPIERRCLPTATPDRS